MDANAIASPCQADRRAAPSALPRAEDKPLIFERRRLSAYGAEAARSRVRSLRPSWRLRSAPESHQERPLRIESWPMLALSAPVSLDPFVGPCRPKCYRPSFPGFLFAWPTEITGTLVRSIARSHQ